MLRVRFLLAIGLAGLLALINGSSKTWGQEYMLEEGPMPASVQGMQGFLQGVWFRFRNGFVDFKGSGSSLNEIRLSINYELPVL